MKAKRTIGLAAAAVVVLLVLGLVPAFAGSASAAGTGASGSGTASGPWAYGGQGWSNAKVSSGNVDLSWNASFGLVALFNATNTTNATVELSEQRTVALALAVSGSAPNLSFRLNVKALELDAASVNLTRSASVTLANGSTAGALGLLNASDRSTVTLAESLVGSYRGSPFSGYLNVTGKAEAHVAFTPTLGLVPLHLTPGLGWSSTSVATATSSWTIAYDWARHSALGSNASSATRSGGWNGTTVVTLSGAAGSAQSLFHDHLARTMVVLALSGPFGLRDGFVLVPSGFDFFDGSSQPYDTEAVTGSATISTESLFVTDGSLSARSVTAARASSTFGSPRIPLDVSSSGGARVATSSPASSNWSTSVLAQPESPSQAKAQAYCLQFTCSSSRAFPLGAVVLGLVVVVAVVATLLVLARRSHRRSSIEANTAAPATVPTGALGTPPAPAPEGPSALPPEGPTGPTP